MKGELLLKALSGLEEAGLSLAEFLVMMTGGMRQRNRSRARSRFYAALGKYENAREEKRRLTALIAQLKHKGFIAENNKREEKTLTITRRGKSKLFHLKKKMGPYVMPSRRYTQSKGKKLFIVVFDIPEKRRRERDWLRDALRNIGFTMLQRSVWIGKIKLQENFITDLHKLYLLKHVEILQISQRGNLQKIL